MHACILFSLFSTVPSFSFLSFSFPSFSFLFLPRVFLFCCDTFLEIVIIVFFLVVILFFLFPPLCTAKLLFIVPTMIEFYHLNLEQPFFSLGVLADHLLVCQPPPLTCDGHDTRQRRLFCLFTCHATMWVLSLSFYTSWHAPSGPSSSLLPLGGMSSQQDVFPKRARARTPE